MNNLEVIKKFLKGQEAKTALRQIYGGYKGRTLFTDGEELVNYQTVIAYKKDRKIIFK